jgi:hypothetical protein
VWLATELFEVFFDFQCGHTAGTGGGDGLAVTAVLHVSTGVDAVNALAHQGDEDVVFGLDVVVGVEIDLAFESVGVGCVADAQEHEADGECPLLAGLGVFELETFEILFFYTDALFDDGVVEELDLRVCNGALQHDARGTEVFGAVDDGDLGGEAGEEDGLFHGGVATADDGDLLAGGEEAVAGGAGADAEADEGLLAGEVEPTCGGAAGDDERACLDDLFADRKLERGAGEVDGSEVGHAELGAKADGLLLHVFDEFGALHALGPAGKVFYQGGDGELSTRLVAFKDERLKIRAGSVDGGGEARASGAQNNSVADGVVNGRGGCCDVGHICLIVAVVKGFRTGNVRIAA